MGWDWNLGVMRYTEKYKEHRRLFHSHFSSSACQKVTPTLSLPIPKTLRVKTPRTNTRIADSTTTSSEKRRMPSPKSFSINPMTFTINSNSR